MLNAGQEIDRYEVIGSIATGGMAEVYKVRHTALGTLHALKVLVLRTQDIRRRLLQEGRVQASFKHENAVAVTDVVDVDGHPGLVMEYVDGPTLLDWCYDEQPDFHTLEQVFRGIVAGVAAAHEIGLVHRDLKPSNVLIARDEEGRWVPKVCDFGLAKVLTDQQHADATRSGVPMGTPSYMAPEQIADAKSVDPRADIFSLGALLYYMCTGRKAFDGNNAVETYNAVLDGTYTPASHHTPSIPLHLLAAIDACLVVNVHGRCADTDALIAILDGGTPPPAPPKVATPPVETSGPPLTPATVGLAALAGFVAGAVLLVFLRMSTQPTVIEPPSAPVLATVGTGDELAPSRRTERGEEVPEPVPGRRRCTEVNGVYGYAPLPDRKKKGALVTYAADLALRGEPDGDPNGCVLPSGTQIEVGSRTKKEGGIFWVEVTPEGVTWPD